MNKDKVFKTLRTVTEILVAGGTVILACFKFGDAIKAAKKGGE